MVTPYRVALVYDRVNSRGGAERVLEALHQQFPDAPLYTSVYDPTGAPWAKTWNVRPSWLQSIPWLRTRHRLLGWLMPFIFSSMTIPDADIILSVTSEAAKSVRPQLGQLHVSYILTPTRYLWSHAEAYQKSLPWWLQGVYRVATSFLRKIDFQSAQQPDVLVTLSNMVSRRIDRYYDRSVRAVIFPSAEALPLPKTHQQTEIWEKISCAFDVPSQFLLTWGRHVSYKEFELCLRVAVQMRLPLVIAGTGPDTARLEALALRLDPEHRFLFFVGWRTDEELAVLLQHARVALFPQEEDFGIAPLEAILAGVPVVVHAKSGAAEVLPQEGVQRVARATVADVARATSFLLSHFPAERQSHSQAKTIERLDIPSLARQYAVVRFCREWKSLLDTLWTEHQAALSESSTERAV